MRIWSLHPKYLDAKGLVALWRETLLAKHVLEGRTKGYKNHPQLQRFKDTESPLQCINAYLSFVYIDATERGYNFDREKIDWNFQPVRLTVTKGQMEYETFHLLKKLRDRDLILYNEIISIKKLQPHPLFRMKKGNVESWEIIVPGA